MTSTFGTPLASLQAQDIQLYRELLAQNSAPQVPVQPDSSTGDRAFEAREDSLERLLSSGLAVPDEQSETGFTPVNPETVGSYVVAEILESSARSAINLLRVREELGPVVAEYRHNHLRNGCGYVTHTGFADINAAIRLAARECRGEVLTSQPGGARSAAVLSESLPSTLEMLDRGVAMRTIYQHNARSSSATRAFVHTIQQRGAQVATLDENFDRLIIFDRTVAFIPADEDRRAAAEIRAPAVVSFLAALFERSWIRALAFTPPGRDQATTRITDDLELAIMRHIVAGDTDSVTAGQLGISVRRCQEYVARMSAKLGSRSRAQLGYLIAKSELLDNVSQAPDASP
ncbi:helix-turn-helix transcriptional regulator [Streptomyces sp. NPDC059564]|uniref:helix-turn-helix transcriptional regulator n=1 Tax=Streptomyces sp. NPDC059564 TaxID=3346865 RepID=UPI00368E9D71